MDFKSKIRQLYKYEKNLLLDKVLMYEVLDEFQTKLLSILTFTRNKEDKIQLVNAINILSGAMKESKVRRQLVFFDTAAHIIHPMWNKSAALGILATDLKERRWNEGQ